MSCLRNLRSAERRLRSPLCQLGSFGHTVSRWSLTWACEDDTDEKDKTDNLRSLSKHRRPANTVVQTVAKSSAENQQTEIA